MCFLLAPSCPPLPCPGCHPLGFEGHGAARGLHADAATDQDKVVVSKGQVLAAKRQVRCCARRVARPAIPPKIKIKTPSIAKLPCTQLRAMGAGNLRTRGVDAFFIVVGGGAGAYRGRGRDRREGGVRTVAPHSRTCTRWLQVSATTMRPLLSMAMPP